MRSGRQCQRGLVDLLHVPGHADRRIAGKDHDRRIAARRHRQRCHDLGVAGTAGDRGDTDLAGCAGIAVGHCHGAMLVPGVDQPCGLVVGHCRRPIHVGVTHQGKQRVYPFGGKGLRQYVGNLVVAHLVCSFWLEKSCLASQPSKARTTAGRRAAGRRRPSDRLFARRHCRFIGDCRVVARNWLAPLGV